MALPPSSLAEEGGLLGVVNVDNLNFRPRPNLEDKPLTTLKKGDRILVLSIRDGWIKGISGNQTGYVRHDKKFISLVKNGGDINKDGVGKGPGLGGLMKESTAIDTKMDKTMARISTLTEKERTIVNGLNEIDQVLAIVRRKAAGLERALVELDKDINETSGQVDNIQKEIGVYRKYAGSRLIALYKLNKAGGLPQVLTSAESLYDLFKRNAYFQQILAYDAKILKNYAEDRERLDALLEKRRKQKNEKSSLMAELSQQMRIADAEKNKRSNLLGYVRSQRDLELAVIESLKEAQEALDAKIKSYARELTKPKAAEKTQPAPKTAGASFSRLKGLLNMPVKGKVISLFGPFTNPKYNVVNFRSGIDIRSNRGEPVQAVYPGRVLFADWFKGYGNMLIIDHGEHYYTVYGNVEELFKSKGAEVKAGETIATVGDSGSIAGPKLYFEIRHHGKPLDPLKWIKRS